MSHNIVFDPAEQRPAYFNKSLQFRFVAVYIHMLPGEFVVFYLVHCTIKDRSIFLLVSNI